MVLTWFVGDAFKTVFFIARHAPAQFIMCGAIQLIVDVLVAIQMRLYANTSDVAPQLRVAHPAIPREELNDLLVDRIHCE